MQSDDPFKGCWSRYDRAVAHRDSAVKLWSEFLDREEAYTISLSMDAEGEGVGRGTLRIWQDETQPELVPILFGEYFYNLRAALDCAVYATAIVDNDWQDPPPGEGVLQFPVCDTPQSWAKSRFRVAPLSERHQAWIESVQPYVGGEDPKVRGIYWLNHLARLDRHRALRVVGAYVAESNPVVSVKATARVTFDDLDEEIFVEGHDGAVVASFRVDPWREGDPVSANPQTALEIELKDFPLGRPSEARWLRMPMRERLFLIESVVQSEVGRLEYDCLGRTRSKYIDTDWPGFKSP